MFASHQLLYVNTTQFNSFSQFQFLIHQRISNWNRSWKRRRKTSVNKNSNYSLLWRLIFAKRNGWPYLLWLRYYSIEVLDNQLGRPSLKTSRDLNHMKDFLLMYLSIYINILHYRENLVDPHQILSLRK